MNNRPETPQWKSVDQQLSRVPFVSPGQHLKVCASCPLTQYHMPTIPNIADYDETKKKKKETKIETVEQKK